MQPYTKVENTCQI